MRESGNIRSKRRRGINVGGYRVGLRAVRIAISVVPPADDVRPGSPVGVIGDDDRKDVGLNLFELRELCGNLRDEPVVIDLGNLDAEIVPNAPVLRWNNESVFGQDGWFVKDNVVRS